MQNYFYSLSEILFKKLQGEEQLLLSFEGEDSDFVRLNHNKIRQAGSTAQHNANFASTLSMVNAMPKPASN